MSELRIEYLSPDELTPYENNTRKHAPDDIESIKKSILDTGFNDPIGIWGDKNLIVEGHGRQIAAKELHLEKVPCIRLDHLTDEQRREYAIRHNRSAELSAWDFEVLEEELARLNLDGIDMDDLNFNFEEMEEMGGVKPEVTEDEAPEPPEVPKTRLGDIYQLGEHRLICGDSTDPAVIERLMDGVKADMVFTDPPYGVSANGGRGDTKKKLKMRDIANDDLREDDLCNFLQSSFSIMPIKDDASVYICYPWATQEEFTKAIKNCDYTLQNCIIWRKNVFGLNGFKGYRPQYEMIYFCSKSDYKWYGDLAQSNVWDFNRNTEHIGGHPTVKPIELIAKALQNSSKKEDCVYDGFGGSGSTLIACEQLNRKCRMAELDPHYCDVIIQRWENLTGQKAVLLSGHE